MDVAAHGLDAALAVHAEGHKGLGDGGHVGGRGKGDVPLHRVEHFVYGRAGSREHVDGPDYLSAVGQALHEDVLDEVCGLGVAIALFGDVGIKHVKGGLAREIAGGLEGGEFAGVLNDAPD